MQIKCNLFMFIKIYFNIKKFEKNYFYFSKIKDDNIIDRNLKKTNKDFVKTSSNINKGAFSNISMFNKINKIKNPNARETDFDKKNLFKDVFFQNPKKNVIGLSKDNNKVYKNKLFSNVGVGKTIFRKKFNLNVNNLNNRHIDNTAGFDETKLINKKSSKKNIKPLINNSRINNFSKNIEALIPKKLKKEKKIIIVVNLLKKYKRVLIDYKSFYNVVLPIYKNNFFILKFLKLKIYTLFYENLLKLTKNKKKILILQLKKKKSKYLIILIINNKIEMMITLGVLLSYAGQKKKSLKRSKKGFEIFLNAVESIYLNFKKNDFIRSIVLDFLDKKIFISKKKIIKLFASSNFFFFSFYTNFGKNFYKKYRSIKKNFLKKNIAFFNKEIRKFYLKTFKKPTGLINR